MPSPGRVAGPTSATGRYRSGMADTAPAPQAPQHPPRRLRPGAPALVAAAGHVAALARPAAGRGPRVHRLLHPLVARARPAGPACSPGATCRGHGVLDNVIMPEHDELPDLDPDPRLAARRRRLPLVLHRQVAPSHVRPARHGGLRLRRLGRQRPPLHGMGRHRRALRPDHRLQRRPLADARTPAPAGRRPAVVPDRGPRQPPRRHVVPRRPARLRGARTPRTWPASAGAGVTPPGRTTRPCPSTGSPTPRSATRLPANFADPLHAKPEAHRQWRWDQQHGL